MEGERPRGLEGERPREPIVKPDALRLPQRHRPVHPTPVLRHNEPAIVFLTVCIAGKDKVLANELAHRALVQAWSSAKHWCVGFYLLMPDHVHLFCIPNEADAEDIRAWVKYWKRLAGMTCSALKSVWQNDCWDTQMRNPAHYSERLAYVRQNPVRAGLVQTPEEWVFQGHLNELRW